MTQIAVTDTHALVWWARGDRRRLGRRARRMFERVESGTAALFVPTLVVAEVGDLARRGIMRVAGGLSGWTRSMFSSGRFFPAELTVEAVLRAESLHSIADPLDRLIAGTAAALDYPLITKDVRIAEAGIDILW